MTTKQEPEQQIPGALDRPPAGRPWREVLLYALAVVLGVAGMLLVPRMLNNMLFVLGVLLLVVWVVPAWLRSRH
jgi:hypothetical protein